MDGLSYSRSVAQYAEQSYQGELERFNQEKQIATAHFEADKKDIVEPVSFVSGGILSAGVGGLGKKLASKTGIKAFENIGKESLSTTLRNVAGEAVSKGKDQVGVLKDQLNTVLGKAGEQSDATKKLINDTLTKNGFEPLSEADFANPSALGDKMLKQSTTKVSQSVTDVAGDASSKVSNVLGDVDQAAKDAKGAVSSTVSDLSSDTGTNLSKTFMTHLNSTDLPTSLNFIKDPVTLDSIKTQSNTVRGVFDNTSASAEFGDETGSASLQAPKTIEQSGENTAPPDSTPKQPTNLSEDSPDRTTPTEDEPETSPTEEPDVPLAPEGDVEDAGNVLSKLSDIVGTADVATGGLDIAGDVLEGAIGIAGLFLPGLLDKQKSAPAIPKNNFVTSYSAGTGIV